MKLPLGGFLNVPIFTVLFQYEPLIQKESLAFVHHIVISKCPDTSDADVGSTYDCFSTSTPDRFMTCSDPVVAWAVGGLVSFFFLHIREIRVRTFVE